MNAVAPIALVPHNKPLSLLSEDFQNNKYEYYRYLREHLPVHSARIAFVKLMVVSRYEDCLNLVKDERFGRNRTKITGGSRAPIPMTKGMEALAHSMIIEDDPEHRRMRQLVQKPFSPKNLAYIEPRIETLAHELLDAIDMGQPVNIQREYALNIPVTVIKEMMGVGDADMLRLRDSLRVLSDGMTGWGILRTFAWDLRKVTSFVRDMIERKKSTPGDDILTQLIFAEEEGDRLSEDELVSMVFLLIIAGFETTVHLISNGIVTLIHHPEELAKLRANPELMGSTVEEILRFNSPIQGTKMNYARKDLELRGVKITKGTPVMPLLGAANHDPEQFPDPERFDIQRDPNKHLSFSQGNHFCLGAFLARMEAKTAFRILLERTRDIELADELKIVRMPGWHRYDGVNVRLNSA